MLTVATLLWDPTPESLAFSRAYDETWVEKLYRGFRRNLTIPFRFVCFTEKPRAFAAPIVQEGITGPPGYGSCIQPYRLDCPMILVGLDTIVTGNCDELARYCLEATRVAVPVDPYDAPEVCNGVALVPAGMRATFFDAHRGENDMAWIRSQDVARIDDVFPGAVVSFKKHVQRDGLTDATRIVYFHGHKKPHEIDAGWVRQNWR